MPPGENTADYVTAPRNCYAGPEHLAADLREGCSSSSLPFQNVFSFRLFLSLWNGGGRILVTFFTACCIAGRRGASLAATSCRVKAMWARHLPWCAGRVPVHLLELLPHLS